MCDFCENIPKTDEELGKMIMNGAEDIIFYDKKRGFCLYGDTGDSGCQYALDNIKFCPICGRKLSEETKHSDPIRQTIKEVAEEMPALGKYEGDYAFPCGTFGYMDDLYRVDFSCSNCSKWHESVIFGTEIVCSCGKKIKTGS